MYSGFFFFQAEDGIRDLVRSRGLGDVYKRQALHICRGHFKTFTDIAPLFGKLRGTYWWADHIRGCLLYTSDAADERSSVDLGGRRIIKKKTNKNESIARGL